MNKEVEDKFIKKFPILFSERNKSPRETCMCWGIETGDGWEKVLWELCEKLDLLCKTFKIRVIFSQVKEKFGALRVYHRIEAGPILYRIPFRLKEPKKDEKSNKLIWIPTESILKYLIRVIPFTGKIIINFVKTVLFAFSYKQPYGIIGGMVDHLISYTENRSAQICEVCGKWGRIYTKNNWLAARCEECASKEGYSMEDDE